MVAVSSKVVSLEVILISLQQSTSWRNGGDKRIEEKRKEIEIK